MTVADYAALGVRRISIGGAMARAAWGGFIRAAKGLAEGRFDGLADAAPHAEINGFFRDDFAAPERAAEPGGIRLHGGGGLHWTR